MKLQGLAKFAKTFGDKFHRIEAVTKLANSMRILDLRIPAVRDAILASKKAPMELDQSDIAIDFDLWTRGPWLLTYSVFARRLGAR